MARLYFIIYCDNLCFIRKFVQYIVTTLGSPPRWFQRSDTCYTILLMIV